MKPEQGCVRLMLFKIDGIDFRAVHMLPVTGDWHAFFANKDIDGRLIFCEPVVMWALCEECNRVAMVTAPIQMVAGIVIIGDGEFSVCEADDSFLGYSPSRDGSRFRESALAYQARAK